MVEERYPMTAADQAALEAEIAELEGPGRREIAAAIKTAREWGDLKENSEYHHAKNEQAKLETKIKRLRQRLRGAEIVDSSAGSSAAGLGSTVTVRDDGGGERTYVLVVSTDSDPAAGRISIESPLGAALSGAGEGSTVEYETPKGVKSLTVVRLG